ncbi:hypothetical protein [Pedobacter zeae]|uniref:Ketosteroid isomerase-like protein n=1 Tax=Pedobacter zeae TaxID=1737356 RepID=A0A7W6K9I7_9SPHI|nr:hypothetical protein [Pedobacter zeae]MBB4107575.1 ketosteroid isomerase-like protein [Pedobacter zeae]GGG98423.1 hypothetical protein GCM10007422_10730 [Pedobacter zeae]
MNPKIIMLQFMLLTLTGFKHPENKKERISNPQAKTIQSKQVPDHLKNWANSINNRDTGSIKNLYDNHAFKIISADNIIEGSTPIANYYRLNKGKITSIKSIFNVEANKERRINYELVSYEVNKQKNFIGIVIWRMNNEKIVREFEFSTESRPESKKVDKTNISERRKLWIELCNAHNAKNLVTQLYSNNTIYYNHKPIVKGAKDVIKEYGYMNNRNYHLNLEPLRLEVVNGFAFEIGQCSGSYNGKYIIVWKKHADGKWYICIDSNI